MPASAVFLDRDGLINEPPPAEQRYLLHPGEFRLMPGIAEAIALLNQARIPVFVVTNQKGVATGRLTPQTLDAIHARMSQLLAEHGASLQAVYACTHQESDACDCRKPAPGLLLRAAREQGVDLSAAWMIGDQPRDVLAGRAAGCRTLLVGPEKCPDADFHLENTLQLPLWIEKYLLSKERGLHPHPIP